MPTTSQPSPKEFSELFQKYLSQGYDILCVHISSKLSGTVDSAQQAKELLGAKNIEIIDSMFITLGTGFQAMAAAKAAKDGASLAECKKIAEQFRSNTNIYFVVSTLEFLKRGGRIGGAAAFLGSALNLKPILMVDDGKIEAHDKIRTMKKAIVKIVDIMEEHVGDKKFYVGISQATARENAEILKAEVTSRFPKDRFVEFVEAGLSPVIGVHAGPGTLSLSFTTVDE
jgi:DegV family protein with EDD domain